MLLASTTPVHCISTAQETNLEFATGRLQLFEALPYDLSALTEQGREAYEMIYAGRSQVHLELSGNGMYTFWASVNFTKRGKGCSRLACERP